MEENPKMTGITSPQTYTLVKATSKSKGNPPTQFSTFLSDTISFLLYFLMQGFLRPSNPPKELSKNNDHTIGNQDIQYL